LRKLSEAYCHRVSKTINDHRITEDAAIGVMALLIHELEGVIIREVLPIGSGGDYLMAYQQEERPIQVEVSGIREDRTGSQASARLSQKCDQVVKHSSCGFASVTTFRHGVGAEVHNYLYFVEKKTARGKPVRRGKKKP
jgi:hypothetical protein